MTHHPLTSGVQSAALASLVLFSVVMNVATVHAATFFVATSGSNSDTGGTTDPWLTIQFAVDQVDPGDSIIVRAGSYTETVLIMGAADSGLVNMPVTLQAEAGAVIDGTGLVPTGRQGLITIIDASFLIIDGFELTNFQTSSGMVIDDTPVGLLIEGDSNNLVIRNNVIHTIYNRSNCNESTGCGPGANGIGIYGTTTSGISDLDLINNEVYDCMLSSSEAFTLNGNITGVRVLDNFIHDNNNIGLDFIGFEGDTCPTCSDAQNRVRNVYVSGNRSINNSINLAIDNFLVNPWYGGGDGSAGGFYVDGGQLIIFDRNISSRNDLGFEFASEMPMKTSEDIIMFNNAIFDNREVGLAMGGFDSDPNTSGGGSTERVFVYNNSFWHNQGWGTEVVFQFRVRDTQLVNNIIEGDSDVNDNHFSEGISGQYSNIRWDNNLWWALNTTDTSGIPEPGPVLVMDPAYTDPASGNLNLLSGSPAIDRGQVEMAISGFSDPFWQSIFPGANIPAHGQRDLNDEPRFEGPIDIGADEFGNFDSGIIFVDGFES